MRDPARTKIKRSQKQERRIASRNGASLHAGSGNKPLRKNDSHNADYVFEQKRTESVKGITIKETDLRDLRNNAYMSGRQPVLTFELNGKDYYVIEATLWEELSGCP